MYRSEHMYQYRTLPMNSACAVYDEASGERTWWLLDDAERDRLTCFVPHRHETLELIFVTDGRLTVVSGDIVCEVNAGELMIFNVFDEHGGSIDRADGRMRYVSLQLELSLLAPAFDGQLRTDIGRLLDGRSRFIRHVTPRSYPEFSGELERTVYIMEEIYRLREKRDCTAADECTQLSLAYELLGLLLGRFSYEAPSCERVERDLNFIRAVNRYLDEHYSEKLTTSTVCTALSYNLNHFCREFKTCFDNTFMNYLAEYRINMVLHAFQHSTLRPTEIAEVVGFPDYGSFARAFKRYVGIPPSKYFTL